jgi:MoaA/NifB/PqqE/SkfB family radical SAM enzyme
MHSNLWSFCGRLKPLDVRITLLSTGLLLARHARKICASFEEVIVSLDGSREVHNRIRSIPQAYESLEEGVRALKAINPQFRVTGRCVLQRRNYSDILNIVKAARDLGLDRISFLAADVSTSAFNRPVAWNGDRVSEIALDQEDIQLFEGLIRQLVEAHQADINSGFIAESADKLRRLPAYYSAINGHGSFPPNRCNAPWVSAVVEADGTVRPCFFHSAFGNIHDQPVDAILNGSVAISFRKNLDVLRNPVCRKCVCTLHLSPLAEV